MLTVRRSLSAAFAASLAVAAFAAVAWRAVPAASAPSAVAGDAADLAALGDVRFVPNRGQWSEAVRFGVIGGGGGWLHEDGFSVRYERWRPPTGRGAGRGERRGAVVRTRFVGAASPVFAVGAAVAGRHHFLGVGGCDAVSGVPAFGSVTMAGVHHGIDVRFRPLAAGDGVFEYDLLLQPGADLDAFVAECEGVSGLRVDAQGQLVATVPTPDGDVELIQRAPVAWQQTAQGDRALEVRFRLLGSRRYGFVAVDRDPTLAAIVDPGVVWASHFGGSSAEHAADVAYVPGVGVWVGGWSGSMDLPTTVGAFAETGGQDAFVAQLSEDGQALVFATYLGGSGSEQVRGLALGPGQTPVVVGFTDSSDFPVTAGAAQATFAGGSVFLEVGDGFVARLAADGSALLASSFLGGAGDDVVEDVVVRGSDLVVTGWTSSVDFPMPPGGVQPQLGGIGLVQTDGFVVVLDVGATSLQSGSFLGGQASEQLLAIDHDPTSGDLVTVGWTMGTDFPATPLSWSQSSAGDIDVVVARFNDDASAAVFATYLGGAEEDVGQDVSVAGDGSIWVGGYTDSANFPATTNGVQQLFGGEVDGFVAHLSAQGQALLGSSFLGGPGQDRVRALDLSAFGLMVVGDAGDGFPVTADAAQPLFATGGTDGFVSLLGNTGGTLDWSSYFGGTGPDALHAVVFDDNGIAVLAGYTFSTDFPIAPAGLQPQLNGVEDAVVLQLDVLADLGAAMTVADVASADVRQSQPGELEVLRFDLGNVGPRTLVVDALRVFVGGVHAGPGGGDARELRVVREAGAAGGGAVVGTVAVFGVGGEVLVPLAGVQLEPGATTRFAATVQVDDDPLGRPVEVGAAVLDASSWQVRAIGAAGGPAVTIAGLGGLRGPVHVLGAFAGDRDQSGGLTVVDVRRTLVEPGVAAGSADTDGDGVWTAVDVAAIREALLGRATLFAPPTSALRGAWLALPMLLPRRDGLQVSLGGRSLPVALAAPRRLLVRVGADQPVGLQELRIAVAGAVVFQGLVEVF